MITISGVAQITQRLSEIILGAVLGLAALGVYTRASSLASLMFMNLYGTATTVIFSQLSKLFRETGVIRDTFLRGLEMILALMWPLLIGLAILSRPVIHVLYGSKWDAAAIPLSLLLVAQFLVLSFGMNWELFVLRDMTAQQTKYEVSRSVAGLVFFSVGCFFGLGAAALGRIADAVVGAIIYLPKMAKLADAKQSEFATIYLKSGALTAAGIGPSLVLMIANGWSPKTPLPMTILSILLGIALWAATLKLLNHSLLGEIKQFFSDRG
jgi:O-antigen/teichoic acid export membrane protein